MRQALGEALLTIINDILDFSKIEAGKLELESRRLRPARLVEESLELLADARAGQGAGAAAASSTPDVPGVRRRRSRAAAPDAAQPRRQRDQVHRSEGEVVGPRRAAGERRHDGRSLRFEVRRHRHRHPADGAAGSSSRSPRSTPRRRAGTAAPGSASPSRKRLVRADGRRDRRRERAGRGQHVLVHRRGRPSRPGVATAALAVQTWRGCRVLVVDDNADEPTASCASSSARGASTVEAAAAARGAAPSCARRGRAARRYDLALLDMQMPGMDGLAAGPAHQGRSDAGAAIPLVLLRRQASRARAPRARRASPPTSPSRCAPRSCCDAVARALRATPRRSRRRRGPCSRSDADAAAPRRCASCVAEDNAVNQKVARAHAGEAGDAVDVVGERPGGGRRRCDATPTIWC